MVETLHRASCRRCPGCRSSPNLYCECLHDLGLLILAYNIFLFCCFAVLQQIFTRSLQDHSLVVALKTMGIMRIQAPLPTPWSQTMMTLERISWLARPRRISGH